MRYVWKQDGFYDRDTGERMPVPHRKGVCVPHVVSDIQPYASPITGKMITSNSERRDDLKRHNCIDARDFKPLNDGKFQNKRFAKKHGLPYA